MICLVIFSNNKNKTLIILLIVKYKIIKLSNKEKIEKNNIFYKNKTIEEKNFIFHLNLNTTQIHFLEIPN